MKRKLRYGIIGLIIYVLLIVSLLMFESDNPGSNIHSIWDAIWYSLVTFTTVGYGDVYPITIGGKVIGAVLIILSVLLFSFLIGTIVSLIQGKLFTMFRLIRYSHLNWYVFFDINSDSVALAKNIAADDDQHFIVFLADNDADKGDIPSNLRCYALNLDYNAIIKAKSKDLENLRFFYMSEDMYANYANGKALANKEKGYKVYALAEINTERPVEGMSVFNKTDCIARRFWQQYPIAPGERDIVVIGNGKIADRLMGTGLLANIVDPDQNIRYHRFGDKGTFKNIHSGMSITAGFYEVERMNDDTQTGHKGRDELYYYEDNWEKYHSLIEKADRIILCDDDENVNFDVMLRLTDYYLTKGKIYTKSECTVSGVISFGSRQNILTTEFVLNRKLTRAANQLNALYSGVINEDYGDFDKLTPFLQQSNIAAADHLYTKVNIILEEYKEHELDEAICKKAYAKYLEKSKDRMDYFRKIEHLRWMRFHEFYNWSFAENRSNELRKHPMLVPYGDLSDEDKIKDDFAWELLEKYR